MIIYRWSPNLFHILLKLFRYVRTSLGNRAGKKSKHYHMFHNPQVSAVFVVFVSLVLILELPHKGTTFSKSIVSISFSRNERNGATFCQVESYIPSRFGDTVIWRLTQNAEQEQP